MKLEQFNQLPKSFFSTEINEITNIFPQPSLITLYEDQLNRPLFLSTLLHGNEQSGYLAIKRILKDIELEKLIPIRPLILFLGNTKAAEIGERQLYPDGLDFNRIWAKGNGQEYDMARKVIALLKKSNLWAAVDIHNNTGKNPFYACISRVDHDHIHLAKSFSSKVIYFTEPHEILGGAISKFCPAITVECGLSRDLKGIDYLYNFIKKLLCEKEICSKDNGKPNTILQMMARVKLPADCTIDFKFDRHSDSDFSLLKDLDSLNFKMVSKGTVIGFYSKLSKKLHVLDNNNETVTDEYLDFSQGKILINKDVVPSMLTRDIKAIRKDSLGYLMGSLISED